MSKKTIIKTKKPSKKMKKFIAVAAVVGLMLTSCVTNEMFDEQTPSEIRMEAVTKVANKAIVEGATVPDDFNFTVFGFFTEDDFATTPPQQFAMYNVDCTKQGTYFKNATQSYYWPLSGKVGFYAIAPADVEPSLAWSTGISLTDYTVTGHEDKDLMFAYNVGSKQAAALDMVFYHALAQVEVALNTDKEYSGATIDVNAVSFKNVDVTADCTYKELSPADQTANPSIAWTNNAAYDSTEEYSDTAQTVVYGIDAAAYGSGIVVIPQKMCTTLGAESMISISYTLTQNSNAISGTIDVPITTEWGVGNKYIYTVTFKLDEILFDPSVEDWVEVATESVTIE